MYTELFLVNVQIILTLIHIVRHCPLTCGDPANCRDSCRIGGKRWRGRRWKEEERKSGGSRQGGFLLLTDRKRRVKKHTEMYFLSRQLQPVMSCPTLSTHGAEGGPPPLFERRSLSPPEFLVCSLHQFSQL